jgi:hypothetical protein
MKQLLKPELVGLMDDDEEEFIMLRAFRSLTLELKEFINGKV